MSIENAIVLECGYMDKDYAIQNEFDFACTNPAFMGDKYNPLLFDNAAEFCADCPIYTRSHAAIFGA